MRNERCRRSACSSFDLRFRNSATDVSRRCTRLRSRMTNALLDAAEVSKAFILRSREGMLAKTEPSNMSPDVTVREEQERKGRTCVAGETDDGDIVEIAAGDACIARIRRDHRVLDVGLAIQLWRAPGRLLFVHPRGCTPHLGSSCIRFPRPILQRDQSIRMCALEIMK